MTKWLTLLALVVVMLSCSTHSRLPASQTYLIQYYWHQAQAQLAPRTSGASYNISHGLVRWRTTSGPFRCGDDLPSAGGCFELNDDGLEITYIAYMPHLIAHEACHAILFILNDPGWGSYCHQIY